MKRKQLGKRVISIVTAATMLLSQGTVMASDLSVDSNGIENQEVAVYENEEEQDLTEEISDAEEDTDIEETIVLDQEEYSEGEEILGDEPEIEQDLVLQLDEEADDTDEILGGAVVEASTVDWKYVYNQLGAALTEYIGTDTHVTIPASIGGNKVIGVKKNLLKEKSELISAVEIQAELTSLPDSFFSDLGGLETVKLSDTIKNMGDYTFYRCGKLKTVKLPAELEKIGYEAFEDCSSLEEIRIPEKVREIGGRAFGWCSALKKIELPENLKVISGQAFWDCSALEEINLPEGLEKIGSYAFQSCVSLKSITLPDSIKMVRNENGWIESHGLESGAFSGCSALKSAKLPKDLTYICDSLFSDCSALKEVEIPGGVTVIGEKAFQDCVSLSRIKLPDKVEEIGSEAFKACIQLVSIYVPEGVGKIEKSAFSGCSLVTIYGTDGSYAQTYAAENGLSFSAEEIPDTEFQTETAGDWSILTDGKQAIITGYTGSQTALIIPKTLNDYKVIGVSKDLLKEKSELISAVEIQAELTSLPDSFFSDLGGLETVKLSDTIKNMGDYTFYRCGKLKTVKLPAELEKIGYEAFEDCSSLEEIRIPEKVREIGGRAFGWCSALKKIELPENLKVISGQAFWDCSALEEINLPEGLEKIGSYAFQSCVSLKSITLPDSIKMVRNENGWIESHGLESGAFSGCSALKSAKLPKDLTYICDSLFSDCSALKEVEIPREVTVIGEKAFQDCVSLSRIKLSDKVEEIGSEAFKDCLVLTNLTAYSRMKSFGSNAFTGDPFLVLSCVNNPTAVSYAKDNQILYTTVDISESGTDCSAQIPSDTWSQLPEGQKLAIDAGSISVVFDAEAVNTIKNASAGTDITLTVKGVEAGNTGNKAQDIMIDKFVKNDGKVLNLSLTDQKDNKVEFNKDDAGTFTITIPYAASNGETPVVFCIYEDGSLEEIQSSYDAVAKRITFVTPHFSVFAVGSATLVPSDVWYEEIQDQFYTGEPIEPSVLVFDHSVLLKRGTDYEVEFTDNIEAGTATVVIKMIGNYTGEYTTTFEIKLRHIHQGVEVSKEATCTAEGQKAYYKCECGKLFWNQECTEEIQDRSELEKLIIPATGHMMQLISAKREAKCEEDGNEATYKCRDCGKLEGGNRIAPLGHNMVLVSGKINPTNTANGNEEKYMCSRCSLIQGGEIIPRESIVTLYKGVNKTYKLTAGKWKLAKTKVATLKKNKITVKKTGTVKVTDQTTKQVVTIRIKNPSLSVSKKKVTLKVGQQFQLTAKAVPQKTVKYSSSNKKAATVSRTGLIMAKRKGKTTISVKVNGMTKKVTVIVK